MRMKNFQRVNAISNAHVGKDFEEIAFNYFKHEGISLVKGVSIPIGVNGIKKKHTFDLGSLEIESKKVLVECKSHKWTTGGNVPSAKLTVWNEAMYYFMLAPDNFNKILFILRDYNSKRGETLGEYYIRQFKHLIPTNVEILEYDGDTNKVKKLVV